MRSFSMIMVALVVLAGLSSCNRYKDLSQAETAQAILEETVDKKNIFGAVVSISSPDFEWTGAHGNLQSGQRYFIASTTKLFTTTVVYQLVDEGKLQLDDAISRFLDEKIMKGLHVYKDHDYSNQLTVRHLLANTSGLPDYFEGKGDDGTVLRKELMSGNDQSWTMEEAVDRSKTMKPEFAPATKGKALYSDTNFQLLGAIIEEITGQTVAEAYNQRIIQPLALTDTYLYTDPADESPVSLHYKKDDLRIPQAMTCFQADGGVVSTVGESMIFIKAFFRGELFDARHIEEAQVWNKIFYPNEYGVGYMRYQLPDFYRAPTFIGHSGLSGAFAWYCPDQDLFITGTVNQLHKPGTSYRMIVKMVTTVLQD